VLLLLLLLLLLVVVLLLLLLLLLKDKAVCPSLLLSVTTAAHAHAPDAVAADLHEQCICNDSPVEYKQPQQIHAVHSWP
jgi:hypothetical protein